MQIFEVNVVLRRVREDAEMLREVQEELTARRLRAMAISSPVLSDMPKAHTNSMCDLSRYYAQSEALILAEKAIIERKARHEAEAAKLISVLQGPARDIMTAYYLGGATAREAAEMTGKTEAAIWGVLFRGIRKIAEMTGSHTAA